jgi:hypothetical protein
MIYACNLEVILSLSPEAMRDVEMLVREWLANAPCAGRTDKELTNFANALRAEIDKARTSCPNTPQGNEDLI